MDLELSSWCSCQFCGCSIFDRVQEIGEQRVAPDVLKVSICWEHSREKKRRGIPCPMVAKSRGTTSSWKEPPVPGQDCVPTGCPLLLPASLQSQARTRQGCGGVPGPRSGPAPAPSPHCSFAGHAQTPLTLSAWPWEPCPERLEQWGFGIRGVGMGTVLCTFLLPCFKIKIRRGQDDPNAFVSVPVIFTVGART